MPISYEAIELICMGINYSQSLWSGISFPPRKDGNAGFFAISTDIDLIRESVYVILSTRKGEMLMNPDFGSSALDMLWENITTTSQTILSQQVKEDIERWEPRVKVTSVAAYSRDNERIININAELADTGISVPIQYTFTN